MNGFLSGQRGFRHHARLLLVGATALGALSACDDRSGLDDYVFSDAVVRGSVRQVNNAPVAGATVQIIAEWRSPCTASPLTVGEMRTAVTDSRGEFIARATIGPVGEALACVSLRVKPLEASGLADTVSAPVPVLMRSNVRGAVFDTVTIDVVVRAK